MNKSPSHLPVSRPIDVAVTPARSTADAEELRRVELGAKQYFDEQQQTANVFTAFQMMKADANTKNDEAAMARAAETREARGVIASAATLRAEGTTRLAIGIGVGVLLGAFVKHLFAGE